MNNNNNNNNVKTPAESHAFVMEIAKTLGIRPEKAMRDGYAAFVQVRPWIAYTMHPVTRTKEGDFEYERECNGYATVLRVLNGRLKNNKGQLDVYAWTRDVYEKNVSKAIRFNPNDSHGAEIFANATADMSAEERDILWNYVSSFAAMELVHVRADWRQVIEVTQKLYDAGLTSVINEWDTNGQTTALNVGDFIVVNDNGVYVIRKDEFRQTHSTFFSERFKKCSICIGSSYRRH